jgi:hypothetical protein
MDEANTNIEAYRVDHLPIVREYAEKIGLVEGIHSVPCGKNRNRRQENEQGKAAISCVKEV